MSKIKNRDYIFKLRFSETLVKLNLMKANDPTFQILGLMEMMDELTGAVALHKADLDNSYQEAILRRKNDK